MQGLLSLSTDNKSDNMPWALNSVNNYIAMGKATYNKLGEEGQTSWFESVDTTVLPTRNEDGTINMHGLLTVNSSAPADSGARLDVTSGEAKSAMPVLKASAEKPAEPTAQPTQKPQDQPEPTAAPAENTPAPSSSDNSEASSGSVKTDEAVGLSSVVGWVAGIAVVVLAAGTGIAVMMRKKSKK